MCTADNVSANILHLAAISELQIQIYVQVQIAIFDTGLNITAEKNCSIY